MTRHHDLTPDPGFDPRVADWLEADPSVAPDPVLETVLAAFPSIPQRRASRLPRRFPIMNRFAYLAAAAATAAIAVVAIAVGGFLGSPQPSGGPSLPAAGSIEPSLAPPSADPSPSTTQPAAAGPAGWRATGGMTAQRDFHTATVLGDGKVLVAGGFVCCVPLAGVEVFDPTPGTWSATASLITPRRFHTASLLADGRVLVAGGMLGGGNPASSLNSAELYEPTAGTWTATGALMTARHHHTATVLPDGRVLVAGGAESVPGRPGSGTYDGRLLASAELYDPHTGTWTATGSMHAAREEHMAILLADGKVVVVGGVNGRRVLASAELYDPSTGMWSITGDMSIERVQQTGTLLANGLVLVAGGGDGHQTLSSAELYDPTTGAWSATASLRRARLSHTATLLANGEVLVAGGQADGIHTLASAELYNASTGTWTSAPSMGMTRSAHTAVLLTDGTVLVAGGERLNPHQWLDSVELYVPGR
jgi:N-acetylneuraminic acid mutarotase